MTRNAIVVGLGAIGTALDKDSNEMALTHASGYKLHPDTNLVAGVDPDADRRAGFEATRDVPGYAMLEDAFESHKVDVVSVCTPTEARETIIETAVNAGVEAILSEKPLAHDIETAETIVKQCCDADVALGVNYHRRYLPGCKIACAKLQDGAVGNIQQAVLVYSKGLVANGSHMIDLARWWFGDVETIEFKQPNDKYKNKQDKRRDMSRSGGSPDAFVTFGDTPCHIVSAGHSAYNHVQMDVYGDSGRVQLVDQGGQVRLQKAHESSTFEGFQTLNNVIQTDSGLEWMCYFAIDDLVSAADGGPPPACDGENALETLKLCKRLIGESG